MTRQAGTRRPRPQLLLLILIGIGAVTQLATLAAGGTVDRFAVAGDASLILAGALTALVLGRRRLTPPRPTIPPGARLVFRCPCGAELGPAALGPHSAHGRPEPRLVIPEGSL